MRPLRATVTVTGTWSPAVALRSEATERTARLPDAVTDAGCAAAAAISSAARLSADLYVILCESS